MFSISLASHPSSFADFRSHAAGGGRRDKRMAVGRLPCVHAFRYFVTFDGPPQFSTIRIPSLHSVLVLSFRLQFSVSKTDSNARPNKYKLYKSTREGGKSGSCVSCVCSLPRQHCSVDHTPISTTFSTVSLFDAKCEPLSL